VAAVVLGQIAGAHGVRGELRVRFFGDGPENLMGLAEVWLVAEEDLRPSLDLSSAGVVRHHAVERRGRGRPGEVRLKLEGVTGREAAEALRGRFVVAPPSHLPDLREGEFYWHQLIGCRVRGSDGTPVGIVCGLMETGAHDVLVVEDESGRRHLIPAAAELVHEIDVESGEIVVELLPGLLEPG